jgi:hypothetical protein
MGARVRCRKKIHRGEHLRVAAPQSSLNRQHHQVTLGISQTRICMPHFAGSSSFADSEIAGRCRGAPSPPMKAAADRSPSAARTTPTGDIATAATTSAAAKWHLMELIPCQVQEARMKRLNSIKQTARGERPH